MRLLDNPVRPYAWGSRTAIPELLGREPTGEPQAELWMGAHPSSPSGVVDGSGRSLLEVIDAEPRRELGDAVVGAFGPRLPFLLKVLAAEEPLSLQAHPDPAQARAGFARENAAGIPLEAPHRTYQDANAKPELLVALTRFEALAGFREPSDVLRTVSRLAVPELAKLLAPLEATSPEGIHAAFTALMNVPPAARSDLVAATLAACRDRAGPEPAAEAGDDLCGDRAEGAGVTDARGVADDARLVLRLARFYPGDVGVVAALLLNYVVLEPTEGIYLPAGNLHTYLHGVGVEILANSDNVLRGGLTGKHVDLPELERVLDFTPRPMPIHRPVATGPGVATYETPAREFRLSRLDVAGDLELASSGAQILLCVDGAVRARGETGEVELSRGGSAYAGAADGVVVLSGQGTLFRATAGV